MRTIVIDSPIGSLTLASSGDALTRVQFQTSKGDGTKLEVGGQKLEVTGADDVLRETTRELKAYFAGKLQVFSVPVDPRGTAFQRRVWSALCEIPFGDTCSYADLARTIDRPSAVRAVGAANGQNPIPIVIPCHRVIGSNGSLVGFGGGLAVKRFLLDLERGGNLLLP